MFWFRVELDSKGKVLSCAQVAKAAEGESGGVFFFQALDGKSAAEKAYREYHRLRMAARRARYAAEGRCKCGRNRDKETPEQRAFRCCPACRALRSPQEQRSAARRKGLTPVPPPSKAEHFVSRRNEEKLELLKEVQDKFLRSGMRVFGLWLQEEIEKLQPKPAAKLRVVASGR